MPLADLLLTTDEIARAGGESVAVSTRNPLPDAERIDITGFDLIPLSTLWCILSGEEWDAKILDSFKQIYEASEDGPWIRRVPDELVQRLCALADDAVPKTAASWGVTEELKDLERRRPGIAKQVLSQIVNLCKSAKKSNRPVFLWMSL